MIVERGYLLLVPFPFSDLTAAKRRPVWALAGLDSYGDFIALPVTTRPQSDHGVPLSNSNLIEGVLPAPSWIRTDRVVTLNGGLVVKTIGKVADHLLASAVERLCAYIGFPPAMQKIRSDSA
jgi:mRNA interferase MazF